MIATNERKSVYSTFTVTGKGQRLGKSVYQKALSTRAACDLRRDGIKIPRER
jgi:hypothetical protein